MNPRQRFRGPLLGLAARETLGTTLEFRTPGAFQPIAAMVDGGPFGLEPGRAPLVDHGCRLVSDSGTPTCSASMTCQPPEGSRLAAESADKMNPSGLAGRASPSAAAYLLTPSTDRCGTRSRLKRDDRAETVTVTLSRLAVTTGRLVWPKGKTGLTKT